MTRTTARVLATTLAFGVALFAAGTVRAERAKLPKLPGPLTMIASADSPGPVTFRHEAHVGERADCTTCHPRIFAILKRSPAASGGQTAHERMEKGALCGACHDGQKAFGLSDDCTRCHAM